MSTTTKSMPKSDVLSSNEERIVYALQILGDKTRYKIFKLLIKNSQMCVSEIASTLGVTTSAISQHFRNFELIGLVTKVRYGQKICYELKFDDDLVEQLVKLVNKEEK